MEPRTRSSTEFFRASNLCSELSWDFLPLGTGNSFLRDFTKQGAESSLEALESGRKRRVDLLRLRHAAGTIYSFNLLSVGFTADVGAMTNRVFKPFGHLGYLAGSLCEGGSVEPAGIQNALR